VETVGAIILVICFFMSIYFAGLSLQISNGPVKMQLLALATSFLVAGIVILIVLMTSLAIKRLFFKTKLVYPFCYAFLWLQAFIFV
jgi:hypothetical protein